ncbi:MAG: DUF167 domain-containing protein [Candidatus Portnoybacteria bacterium]|nr:DUF167 domain-containing protein [Candidatus Portnoybacteria bacterium]MDD4982365.1 DUF167 domain-containing protein [Candidatus Portnoybacteria bacterium]
MIIHIKAKPDGYEDKMEKIDEAHFVVETREPPVNGRANLSIRNILARYFNVDVSKVRIIKGFKERSKIFEINS